MKKVGQRVGLSFFLEVPFEERYHAPTSESVRESSLFSQKKEKV
jgi:hypothetical protein